MGVFIDYSFYAECSEADLVQRLRCLRRKILKLRLGKVGRIERMDPVFSGNFLRLLPKHGFHLPREVCDRLKGKWSRAYGMKCHYAASPAMILVPRKLEQRHVQPAVDLMKSTRLWKRRDLPEKVNIGSITIYRKGFAFELACALLRYGYLMTLDPGEGCETVSIGLTAFRGSHVPMWLGSGFTKTQYAAHFITAHTRVCRVLDCAREEGLLLKGRDTCGYYEHRNWQKSAPIVNKETTFAHVVGQMLSAGVEAARAAGMPIQDISNPATKNYNLIRVESSE